MLVGLSLCSSMATSFSSTRGQNISSLVTVAQGEFRLCNTKLNQAVIFIMRTGISPASLQTHIFLGSFLKRNFRALEPNQSVAFCSEQQQQKKLLWGILTRSRENIWPPYHSGLPENQPSLTDRKNHNQQRTSVGNSVMAHF